MQQRLDVVVALLNIHVREYGILFIHTHTHTSARICTAEELLYINTYATIQAHSH